ncbi:hypothetical protein EfmE1071_2637 [Enterococcus faecium E1071]|nr:hypothetical protein EfmE1071_2637 [Enterococcus faecium E1071]
MTSAVNVMVRFLLFFVFSYQATKSSLPILLEIDGFVLSSAKS